MMQFEMKGAESFNNEELVEFFQQLIDNGLDVKNKGKYSVIAKRLIKEKRIFYSEKIFLELIEIDFFLC